ncbi:MAG: hypothetical protein KGL39_09855 [Patescibacteria group bacterium]|nr:hypothetical protein [Patescibacteria group bacterium]
MNQATAQYFIGNRFFGESTILYTWASPESTAYFCRTCGEIWARIWVRETPWELRQVPCEKHLPVGVADWSSTPGSILHPLITKDFCGSPQWASTIEHLPETVIRREFFIHINQLQELLA